MTAKSPDQKSPCRQDLNGGSDRQHEPVRAPACARRLSASAWGASGTRRELADTPSVRGMVNKVRHLVHVEEK